MNSFQQNTAVVLNYLRNNSCSETVLCLSHSCFTQLGAYLKTEKLPYSNEAAVSWLSNQSKTEKTKQVYAKAISRLNDVYQVGHVRFQNRLYGLQLTISFESVVTTYLKDIAAFYSSGHLATIDNRCRFFFGLLQMDRLRYEPSDITYDDIIYFYTEAKSSLSKAGLTMYKGSVMQLLVWMAEHQLCPTGFSVLLLMNRVEKTIPLSAMLPDAAGEILRIGRIRYEEFPPEEFLDAAHGFCEDIKSLGYASTSRTTSRSTLEMLFLFLDMNQLGYDPVVARLWFESAHTVFGTNELAARRVLRLFEEFAKTGEVCATQIFVYKKRRCDDLPDWCREMLFSFLELKRREGMASSTIDMYRSAITRFCSFIVSLEIERFDQIDAHVLKQFNLEDPHATVEGKNAYNVRIRKFLFYLYERGVIENPLLGQALACSAAPREEIVKILNEEDVRVLEDYHESDPALSLRNRAIVMIGLKMGLRCSDITALTFSQIDWKNQTMRFCQDKTDVEKILPIPTDVANAIYEYLTVGRPASNCQNIFIAHKAPYQSVSRGVCTRIMSIAFAGRPDTQSGFHVLRKTYATQRFRNHCGYTQVADLLGHTSTETVRKYISLDEERMRLCPIALETAGILMKGGFRGE